MKGVLVVSHGNFARGMVETARFIFGHDILQLDYCCLDNNDNPVSFEKQLSEKCEKADSGDGVIILLDIYGGVCMKKAAMLYGRNVEIICGANMPLLMEILTKRMYDNAIDIGSLIDKGRAGITDLRTKLADTEMAGE